MKKKVFTFIFGAVLTLVSVHYFNDAQAQRPSHGRLVDRFSGPGYECFGCPSPGGPCYDDGSYSCVEVEQ